MAELVLVGSWQHQCCGDLVAIGDVVSWRLRRALDRGWLARTYGPALTARLTAVEERHDDPGDDDEVVQARVTGLWSVICRERPEDDDARLRHSPVDEGGRLEPRRSTVRGEPERDGEVWCGYVVELDRV